MGFPLSRALRWHLHRVKNGGGRVQECMPPLNPGIHEKPFDVLAFLGSLYSMLTFF